MTEAESPDLRDQLVPFIGERAVALLSYALADAAGAESAAGFRDSLVAAGEDPDNPQVTEAEQLLIDWARDPSDKSLQQRLAATFNAPLRGLLAEYAAR